MTLALFQASLAEEEASGKLHDREDNNEADKVELASFWAGSAGRYTLDEYE